MLEDNPAAWHISRPEQVDVACRGQPRRVDQSWGAPGITSLTFLHQRQPIVHRHVRLDPFRHGTTSSFRSSGKVVSWRLPANSCWSSPEHQGARTGMASLLPTATTKPMRPHQRWKHVDIKQHLSDHERPSLCAGVFLSSTAANQVAGARDSRHSMSAGHLSPIAEPTPSKKKLKFFRKSGYSPILSVDYREIQSGAWVRR
jgi:hypothetical protein